MGIDGKKGEDNLSKRQKGRILSLLEKFGSSFKEADVDNVENNLESMNRGPVASVWDKVEYLWNRFRTESTPKEKALIIGALIYLVIPLDVLPDVIPSIGLVDDVFAILFVFNKLMKMGSFMLKSAGEKVMRHLIDPLIEKEVLSYMESLHLKRLVSSLINFLLYVIAVLLVLFPLFGRFASSIISSLLLSLAIGYGFYRFIKLLRGDYFIPLIKAIWREKSVKKGLASFIRGLDPRIVKMEKFSDKFFLLLGEDGNERTLERFIDHCYLLLKKDIIRFLLIECAIVLLFFILRSALLRSVPDLSFLEIVFYPYVSLFSLI